MLSFENEFLGHSAAAGSISLLSIISPTQLVSPNARRDFLLHGTRHQTPEEKPDLDLLHLALHNILLETQRWSRCHGYLGGGFFFRSICINTSCHFNLNLLPPQTYSTHVRKKLFHNYHECYCFKKWLAFFFFFFLA